LHATIHFTPHHYGLHHFRYKINVRDGKFDIWTFLATTRTDAAEARRGAEARRDTAETTEAIKILQELMGTPRDRRAARRAGK